MYEEWEAITLELFQEIFQVLKIVTFILACYLVNSLLQPLFVTKGWESNYGIR